MSEEEIGQIIKTMSAPVDTNQIHLETPRLLLRPLTAEDLSYIHAICSQPEVAQTAGFPLCENLDMSRDRLKEYMEDGETVAVVLKENQKVIGTVSLQKRYWPIYPIDRALKGRELGFDLNKDYWGRGLMPEAVRCLCDWCFDAWDYDFLTAGYFQGNSKSQRAIEKCGFSFLFEDDRSFPNRDTVHILTYICYNSRKEQKHV